MNERGQALVELALTLPVLMLLGLGAADVGYLGLRTAVWQNAAQSIAAEPDAQAAELERSGCEMGSVSLSEVDGLRIAELTCPNITLTGLLPDSMTVSASAPMGSGAGCASAFDVGLWGAGQRFGVNLEDETLPPQSDWQWTFGDGSGSTEQDPSHEYLAEGQYTITLSAGPCVPLARMVSVAP